MAQYLVIKVAAADIPPLNGSGSADVYRGEFATEAAAVTAAITKMGVRAGEHLWAVPVASLTRYTSSITSVPG